MKHRKAECEIQISGNNFCLKGILSILDQNFDHGDFVYICMTLKELRVLNGHAVTCDTYIMYLI